MWMAGLRGIVSTGRSSLRITRRCLGTNEGNTDSMNAILHSEYVKAKNSLAVIMGMDPSQFSDMDFKDSIEYLLPTDLKDNLARPSYNRGAPTIHMRKETINERNRPCDSYFYCGAPSYYKLKYQVYNFLSATDERKPDVSGSSFVLKDKFALERILDESMGRKKYDHLVSLVKELNSSKFPVQEEFLKYFHNTSRSTVNEVQVSYKRLSVGRRKTAIAKVRVKNGDGKVLINSKSLLEYFPRLEDRQQVLFPLNLVGCLGKVDVSAEVSGGGVTGQAGAVRVGLSRALINLSSSFIEPLEKSRLTSMDSRRVERKKPGQKKARKSFAWVKR